jgi:hypothetical protein
MQLGWLKRQPGKDTTTGKMTQDRLRMVLGMVLPLGVTTQSTTGDTQ